MKWILVTLSLLTTHNAWAFGPEYKCAGSVGSELHVKVHITRAGERVSALLLQPGTEEIAFTGFQSFGAKSYSLLDSLGNPAELSLAYQFAPPKPCGRGGCELGPSPLLKAHLSYLGAAKQFTCHEAP